MQRLWTIVDFWSNQYIVVFTQRYSAHFIVWSGITVNGSQLAVHRTVTDCCCNTFTHDGHGSVNTTKNKRVKS